MHDQLFCAAVEPTLELDILADHAARFEVLEVQLQESLEKPYDATVVVALHGATLPTATFLHASGVLSLRRPAPAGEQRFCGVVHGVEYLGQAMTVQADAPVSRFRLRFGPALGRLAHQTHFRIFVQQRPSEILRALLEERLRAWGRTVRFDLRHPELCREVVIQYRESDLDFALRLCRDNGLMLRFEHGQTESIVLFDDLASLGEAATPTSSEALLVVSLEPSSATAPTREALSHFAPVQQAGPNGYHFEARDWTEPLDDHTWVHPSEGAAEPSQRSTDGVHDATRMVQFGDYDMSEQSYGRSDGAWQTQLAVERAQAAAAYALGQGDVLALRAGEIFRCEHAADDDLSKRQLVISIEHHWQTTGYHNRFRAVAVEGGYRPTRLPAPAVPACLTATVVGPPGENVHTDTHGRIQVALHGAEICAPDPAEVGAWVRVMQPWAGDGYGLGAIPRVGCEVVVGFLAGDLDRPIVLGGVHNGAQSSPLELPKNALQSVWRSDGWGERHHALTFDDSFGAEAVSLRAQTKLEVEVVGKRKTTVSKNDNHTVKGRYALKAKRWTAKAKEHSQRIKGNSTTKIGGQRSVRIRGDDRHRVDADWRQRIDGAADQQVKRSWRVRSAELARLQAPYVRVEADKSLRLQVGKAALVLQANGEVRIEGRAVRVSADGVVQLRGQRVKLE